MLFYFIVAKVKNPQFGVGLQLYTAEIASALTLDVGSDKPRNPEQLLVDVKNAQKLQKVSAKQAVKTKTRQS
jgi:hypothetical protein